MTRDDCAIIYARRAGTADHSSDAATPIAVRARDKDAFDAASRFADDWVDAETTTGQRIRLRPASCGLNCRCAAEWEPVA